MGVLEGNRRLTESSDSISSRSASVIPFKTSTVNRTHLLSPLSRLSKEASPQRQCIQNVVSQSSRASAQYSQSGVLQSHLCNPQESDRVETDHQSVCTQSIPNQLPVYHGNCHNCPRCHGTRPLGCDHRPKRGLLAGAYAPLLKEVSQIHSGRQGLSAHHTRLWARDSSEDFHGTGKGVGQTPQVTGHCDSYLFGRLDYSSQKPQYSGNTVAAGPGSVSEMWNGSQLQEISVSTDSGHDLYRYQVQAGSGPGSATSGEIGQVRQSAESPSATEKNDSREVEITDRPDVFHDEADSVGQINDQAFPVASGRQLVTGQGLSEGHSESVTISAASHSLVERQTEHTGRSQSADLQGVHTAVHRCELGRLGSPSRGRSPGNTGEMVLRTEEPRYQLEGAQSSCVSSSSPQEPGQRSKCLGSVGQFHSGRIHQQTRGYAVSCSDGTDLGTVLSSQISQVSAQGSSYSGPTQHGGGYTEQRQPAHTHRVVSPSRGSESAVEQVGQAAGGSVRHQVQQKAGVVCVSNAGQSSMEGRCSVSGLDGPGSLRLSSGSTPGQSVAENDGRAMYPHPNRSVEDGSPLVSTTPPVVNRPTVASIRQGGSLNSTTLRSQLQKRGRSKTARLETIQSGLRKEGYSDSVAEKAAKCRKSSTLNIYDSKWLVFVDWCSERDMDPLLVTAGQVASFLEWLFEGPKKASPSTVAGYRAAISKVLKANGGIEISNNQVISDLMSYFKLQRPSVNSKFPKWDLVLVLKTLKKPPFVDMVNGNLKFITWKTVFLLLLAVGARRGEVHAIDSSSITQLDNFRSMVMKPNPVFMAKTHNMGNGGVLSAIKVDSLKEVSGKNPDMDYDLCPVRAVKYYMSKTEPVRKGIKQLFITYKAGDTRPAAKNTISSWVKQLILYSYEHAQKDQELIALCQTSTHELRALSSSLALFNNVAIEDILSCCRWSNQTTFTSHYLRDCSDLNQKIHQVLPLSVAGGVIRK